MTHILHIVHIIMQQQPIHYRLYTLQNMDFNFDGMGWYKNAKSDIFQGKKGDFTGRFLEVVDLIAYNLFMKG